MLRIAICDDEKDSIALNESLTKAILKDAEICAEIITYGNGDFLLYDVQEKRYFDIILLDIEMPGNSGMEIAVAIKKYLPRVLIIFITSHLKYAVDSFELSIFRYIPKDNVREKLRYALVDAAALISIEAEKEYTIATASRFEKIPYKEIMYIQKDGKNSVLVTTEGEIRVRKSLAKVMEEINAEEFLFIDRGCVVNILYIKRMKDTDIILKNGVRLPMSRLRVSEIKKFINTYWGQKI